MQGFMKLEMKSRDWMWVNEERISESDIHILLITAVTIPLLTFDTSPKTQLEKIEDASTELMMGNGDRVMIRLGEAMFEATEDEATEFCEIEMERTQKMLDKLSDEEADILEQQSGLKKVLYGRFGKSINLEEK